MNKPPSTTGQKIEQAFEKALDPFATALKRATRPAEPASAPAPAFRPRLTDSRGLSAAEAAGREQQRQREEDGPPHRFPPRARARSGAG